MRVYEGDRRSLGVLAVEGYSESALKDILRLEAVCYPKEWRYPDEEEYYSEMLKSEDSIHLFLCDGDLPVGYLLGLPLSESYDELRKYDPELRDDPSCFYLETIGIDPSYSGRGGGSRLLEAFRYEVSGQSGRYERISAHARKKEGNDLSGLIRKMYDPELVRHISRWRFGGNEPYDYIVWSAGHQKSPL